MRHRWLVPQLQWRSQFSLHSPPPITHTDFGHRRHIDTPSQPMNSKAQQNSSLSFAGPTLTKSPDWVLVREPTPEAADQSRLRSMSRRPICSATHQLGAMSDSALGFLVLPPGNTGLLALSQIFLSPNRESQGLCTVLCMDRDPCLAGSSRARYELFARTRARHTEHPAAGRRGCCGPGEESRATNSPSAISAAPGLFLILWLDQPGSLTGDTRLRSGRLVLLSPIPKHLIVLCGSLVRPALLSG